MRYCIANVRSEMRHKMQGHTHPRRSLPSTEDRIILREVAIKMPIWRWLDDGTARAVEGAKTAVRAGQPVLTCIAIEHVVGSRAWHLTAAVLHLAWPGNAMAPQQTHGAGIGTGSACVPALQDE
jgi:hypothetical protein